jgi:eukaryotic-like serine/threonine-protein kinase
MAEVKNGANQVDEVAEEFACRWRAGERPTVEEYAGRFPLLAEQIRAVLPAVAMMEQLRPRREDAATLHAAETYPERATERVGEYRIVREIGRGGMGVVYEADQAALGRRVAIKVLPGRLVSNEKLRERFRREAQAAARLHHTSIVPVFAAGESDGQCYYVMQLIEGRGLDRIIREAATKSDKDPLEPREYCRTAAGIGFQVAEALAYAHAHGVLHRDIKPSNLLLDERGTVWVTDFGVAKLAEGTNLTESGDFIGTLKYMPPERFAGRSDARGDVYSLGMTLYELLTFRSAFPDTTPHNLIQLITQQTPIRPGKLNPAIPKDLETIVMKAAARDAAHRYNTAQELAEDLRRFLYDRPILAKRTGPAEQLWRWCRRNPALAGLTAAALLLMVAVTLVSVVAYAQTSAANRDMEKALAAEKAQRDHAETTAALALEALNRTYDRFAPSRLVVVPPVSNEVGVELPPQPATLPPEAVSLLEDLLRTYEQIARAGGEFPKLRAQAAEANHRIGGIRRRLGRFKDATVAYQAAIDLYTDLLPESHADGLRIKLARAYNEYGRTLRSLQMLDESKRMHESAIQTLTDVPKALADRPESRYELAYSYYALDVRDMFVNKGPPDKSRPPGKGGPGSPPFGKDRPPPGRGPGPKGENPTQRAVGLLEGLVREFPTVPEYRHLLACCYRDMPPDRPGWGSQQGKGSPDRALDLLRQLVDDFPTIPDYRLDLCETLARGGGPGGPPGEGQNTAKVEERLQQAIELSAELVTQYPNVPEYAAGHARYLDQLGMRLVKMERWAEAEPLHRQAVTLQKKLVQQYPDVIAFRLWLSLMERSLGDALSGQGQLQEARVLFEGAISRVEDLWKKDARLVGLRPFLGRAYRNLAWVLQSSGEQELAAGARRKAEELDGKGGKGPPKG